jgi:hypothetical protein
MKMRRHRVDSHHVRDGHPQFMGAGGEVEEGEILLFWNAITEVKRMDGVLKP